MSAPPTHARQQQCALQYSERIIVTKGRPRLTQNPNLNQPYPTRTQPNAKPIQPMSLGIQPNPTQPKPTPANPTQPNPSRNQPNPKPTQPTTLDKSKSAPNSYPRLGTGDLAKSELRMSLTEERAIVIPEERRFAGAGEGLMAPDESFPLLGIVASSFAVAAVDS